MFDLDTMLRWHLMANHFPPLPVELIPVAKEAIERGRDEEFDHEIAMPVNLKFRHRVSITVREAIATMHLEGFLGEWDGVVLEDT